MKSLLSLLLVISAWFVFDHCRGERSLRLWKQQMEARGEIFEASRLWPAPSARCVEFSNQLSLAVAQLPPALATYAGQMSGIVPDQPGQSRRGSQEPAPPMAYGNSPTNNTWEDLVDAVRQARPGLQALRNLLKDPPPGVGYSIVSRLEENSFPNLVNDRRGAQALQAAALAELHEGNLELVLEDLIALQGFVKLRADDPSLVSFMIRVAILGLSVDVAWDALQAKGWTEPQLSALQQACEQASLLQQMPRTMEAERATRIHNLDWFRAHSYEEWIARYEPIWRSFGCEAVDPQPGAPARLWQQWAFHPVWSFAWADLEQLDYLQAVQQQLAALRQVPAHGSWRKLNQDIAASRPTECSALGSWRFYIRLPLAEEIPDRGRGKTPQPSSSGPDFSRAWFTTLRNLTLHQLVVTAVALKRSDLRHGHPPTTLDDLVPEFLPSVPRDLMDGQPLRYQLHGDGSFALYSVGEDTYDNGGDPEPSKVYNQSPPNWTGRDWVWPELRPATSPIAARR